MKKGILLHWLLLFIAACNQKPIDKQEENGIVNRAKINSIQVSENHSSFKPTGFSNTCDSLIQLMQDSHLFGSVNIDPEGTFLEPREFITVLSELKNYDLTESSQIVFEENRCNNIISFSWTNNNVESKTTRIQRNSFVTTVKDENWANRGEITIQEFYIHRKNKPNEIYLRAINNYLKLMKMDGRVYIPNYSYTPEAYDKAEIKLASVSKNCK